MRKRLSKSAVARGVALALAATLTFTSVDITAFATETGIATQASSRISISGTDLSYTLDNGVLTISGKGRLPYTSTFFGNAAIKKIIVNDGVTAIGNMAFYRCSNLVSVSLPESVKVIERDAFRNCTSLQTIELKEGLTKIGQYAFEGDTSLRNISIPKSVSVIEYSAFYGNWKNTDVAKKIQQFKALGNDFFYQTYNDIPTYPNASVKLVGYLDGSTTIRTGEMLEAQIESYEGKGKIYYSYSSDTCAFESTDTYLTPDDMPDSASTSGVLANKEYNTTCSIMAYIVEGDKIYKTNTSTYDLQPMSLKKELENVSVIMAPGESLSIAQILGRAGITHITTCLSGNDRVSGEKITEGSDFATLYNKQITIKNNADNNNNTVKVSYNANTAACSYHGTDTASDATITIHILPKLNYKATDKKITINNPQEGYDYYIDNIKGTESADGKITFSGLTPDTEYVIQTKSQTRGEGQTSEKVTTLAKVNHEWNYTANGNQISATCTADHDCDYKGDGSLTLTLNADDAGYTGEPYTGATIVGDLADETGANVSAISYVGRDGTTYTESTTAPTERGTYTAKVTVTDSNGTQYTATKDFEITMGTQTATVNMPGYTYDTPVSNPSLVGAKEDPTVTYYYYPKDGDKNKAKEWENIDADTLDPGAYYIYAEVSATTNYEGCETDPVEFTVAGKDMNSDITATDVDVTYDGEPHGITVTGDFPTGYSIKYGTEDGEYTLDKSPEYTDVATDEDGQVIANTVYYEVTARGYNTFTGSATVKINPLEAELKWDNTDLTYNGTAQAPTATVTNLKSQGETTDECTVTVYGAQTNAGDNYTAIAKALSNKNYVLSTDNSKIKTGFNIAKKEIGINWADLSFTYDGEAHVPTATATDVVAGDTCDITVSGDKTNAGTYTATASILNNNYELPAEHTKSFTINPKELTAGMISLDSNVSGKNSNTYLFTGAEITLGVKVSDGTDKILAVDKDYILSGDTKATKYGEYTLKVEGKNNYTGTISVTWNIDEKNAPTGTIKVGKNSWNSFWHTVTFGHFFKKTATVTVSAADGENESGVDKVYYVVSDKVYSNEADVAAIDADNWTEIENGGSFDIEPNAKKYVYVKITDKAGNTSYINSDGIVVYTDAKSITESLTYTKTTKEDKTAEVTLNGNTIKEVRNGDNLLTKDTDYTLSEDGSKVTFKGAYLQSLSAGEYTITVSYNPLGEDYKTDIVDGADANEAPQATSIALNVVKAEGSVTGVSDISKVYDAKEVAAPEFTTTNPRGDGDSNVSITYKAKGADDSTFTAEAPKNAGAYVVRVSVAADENYNAATVEKEFTISPKLVKAAVTAENKIYDGNAYAVVSATVETGIRGESLTIAGLSGKFEDANAGKDKEVTPVSDFATVTAGENTIAGNYSVLYPKTKADIKPKTIGITWGNNEFVYNGQPQAPTVTATGLISGDKCDIIVDGARTDVGTKTVKATGVSNSNYVLSDDDSEVKSVKVNIKKKTVTVTANDAAKHVTTADPQLGYTVTGLVGKDTLDDVTVTREEGENVSTAGKYYRITATADADSYPNYDITFVDGKFTITDHTWSDWKEILAPTATANGKKESVCSICGHSRYENIPATGLPAEEDPTDGKFEKDVQVAPDSPIKEATMTNSSSALLEASNIFTKEEKALINDKKVDSKVWLEITNTDISKLSEETKKSVLEKAASIMGKDVTEDDIMFFDADLFKKVIDSDSGEVVTEKTAIREPGEDIGVTIKIPDELLMDPAVKSMVRVYKIIRIHTDETTGAQTVDVIDGNFDEETGEFSFTTDKFSTYAIAFTEVPLEVSIAADESSATDGTKLGDGKVELTKKGDTIKFTATVTPDSASKRKVTWTSSNPSVATVDENGVVTAVANGTTTITATVADGGAIAEYTVSVNIPKKQETVKQVDKPTNKPADKTTTKPSADKTATAKQNAKTTTIKAKKTGDNNATALWLVLMLGGCAIAAFGRKKKFDR